MRVDVLVVVTLERRRLVSAARLSFLRAVVLAVLVGALLVKNMTAGDLGTLLFKLSLGSVDGGLDILLPVQ